MEARHVTYDETYRFPFGAIHEGETVELAIDVWDDSAPSAFLRLWTDEHGEQLLPMERIVSGHDSIRFEIELTPHHAGKIWYRFDIVSADTTTWRYGAHEGASTGEGGFVFGEPPSFLLQVYDDRSFITEGSPHDIPYWCPDPTTTYSTDLELGSLGVSQRYDAPFEPGEDTIPIGNGIVGFVTGGYDAFETANQIEGILERCPHAALSSLKIVLSTPDRTRLFTYLGRPSDPYHELDVGEHDIATTRLWMAASIQMCLPGTPYILQGDEWGSQGPSYTSPSLSDKDEDCFTIYRNAIALRKTLPLSNDDICIAHAMNEDVLTIWRHTDESTICLLVNQSTTTAHTIPVPVHTSCVHDVISGKHITIHREGSSQYGEVFLWPLGTALLYFYEEQRSQKSLDPGYGVICHMTSIPNIDGPGTLGAPAYEFIDRISDLGYTYWQMLPIGPTDEYRSPYAGPSAFAGNTNLLERSTDRAAAYGETDLQAFMDANSGWLLPYATFVAIKNNEKGRPWWEWPTGYRTWDPELAHDDALVDAIHHECVLQYMFDLQWRAMHSYAHEHGVKIIGDVPMYVSTDSADVWANPTLFDLDEQDHPRTIAGCPPDDFSKDGQLWGNVTYRWDEAAKTGYRWWMQRFARSISYFDYVRLDHFLGFSSYYAIPSQGMASEGQWRYGPGLDIFTKAFELFGPLPFIAEDLGSITPAVRALRAETGFLGMDVIQFEDDVPSALASKAESILYTSTHDTPTLIGWIETHYDVPYDRARTMARDLRGATRSSDRSIVIEQLQDILELDDVSRMNTPGTKLGNWTWQASFDALEDIRA